MRHTLSPLRHALPDSIPHILFLMHHILHHVFLERLSQLALRLFILLVRYALQL